MASDSNIFAQLTDCARQFDKFFLVLNDKLTNESARQPASMLNRLNKQTCALQETMNPEVDELRKHNRHMEKTIAIMTGIMKQKKELLGHITSKIDEYTLQGNEQNELSNTRENHKVNMKTPEKSKLQASSNRKQSQAPPSSQKGSQAPPINKTPLKNVENVKDMTVYTPPSDAKSLPVTPRRTASQTKALVSTPQLTDFLPVDYMCERLETDNLITKASKRSSSKKKTPGSQSQSKYGVQAPPRSAVRSKKSLALSTPGKKPMVEDPSTPILPDLVKVDKPDFGKIPKPDFTGRIAMIDVVEYHSQIDGFIKQLMSLELINKVIHKLDLMFQLTPGVPVEMKDLFEMVEPLAGSVTKICLTMLMKLKRLKAVGGGKELMIAVLGNPT